ncbi:hypothetical protein QP786_00285, partial [Gleimia europaea]|nr:hypothetical protein [Gleimia europaea]
FGTRVVTNVPYGSVLFGTRVVTNVPYGSVLFGTRVVTNVPLYRRYCHQVPQSYGPDDQTKSGTHLARVPYRY